MKLALEQKIQAGFALASVSIVLTCMVAWWSANRNVEAFDAVAQTYQVREQLENALVEILSIETGNHGFAISGDEEFLEPYEAGISSIHKSVETARFLARDNPNEQRHLAELEALVQQRISIANNVIALCRSGDRSGALGLIASGQGERMTDAIRATIREMKARESRLLLDRSDRAQARSRLTIAVVSLGSLLALVFVGLAQFIVRWDFKKRQEAEAERDRFFKLSLDMLCVARTDGYFKRLNPAFTETLGWSIEELQARPFLDFVHPDDRPGTLKEVEKLADGETVIRFLNRYQCRDGSWRWLSWRSVPDTHGIIYATARDVTKQVETQEALQASTEWQRAILDSATASIISTDPQGVIVSFNRAAERMLGYTAKELIGRETPALIHVPEEVQQTAMELSEELGEFIKPGFEVFVAKARRSLVAEREWRYVRKDGSRFPVLLSVTALRDAAGNITGFLGIGTDITERKRMDEALRCNEESLSVTLNSIGDAVLATDREGRVTRMNPVAEELMGWTQVEALGRPVAEVFCIINEETREPAHLPVETVLATGKVKGLANHTVLITRDGMERLIADSAAPIKDKSGQIRGVVLVFRDVTQEKKAEHAIEESERRLRILNGELEQRVTERTAEVRQAMATLDAIDDGAFIFDPDTLRFSYVNEGAMHQLCYTREELLNMTALEIQPEYDETEFRTMLAPMLRGEANVHEFKAMHRHKQGHDIPVEVKLQYVAPRGECPRFIALARDITERVKMERQANRSQRLESIGQLAGGIAHDLNNALAPILMSVELLRMRYPTEADLLEAIHASAKNGADMVRQLLTFAKGAEGERTQVQPRYLLREMRKIIRSAFPKNIHLEIKFDPQLPSVLGDATQMHQVLLNLCVNARDAMPNGGNLTLEANVREVDAFYASSVPGAKPGQYVALQVTDTGGGIAPAILDQIFDPFFTTKGPDKGTGLGLSTVMGIVKGHDGFLQVYSQPEKGSTFTAYLPAYRSGCDTSLVTKADVKFRGREELILFVDDEVLVRGVARNVLAHLNFKVVTATDGADALIQLVEHRSELRAVITDLHMPHMDGLALVQALRRMMPDIPVVVASGRLERQIKEQFNELNVSAFLPKPFTETQLTDVLEMIFASEQQGSVSKEVPAREFSF